VAGGTRYRGGKPTNRENRRTPRIQQSPPDSLAHVDFERKSLRQRDFTITARFTIIDRLSLNFPFEIILWQDIMTDPDPRRHWNVLAEQLGVEAPAPTEEERSDAETADTEAEKPIGWHDSGAEDTTLPGSPAPSSGAGRSKKRREPKQARTLPETDWSLLAGSLGVQVPEPRPPQPAETTDEVVRQTSEVEVSESIEISTKTVVQRSDARAETTPVEEPPADTRDNFMDELPDTDALDSEPEAEEAESESSSSTESTGRKRRRRGRRGRRRRTGKGPDRAEGGPEETDSTDEQRDWSESAEKHPGRRSRREPARATRSDEQPADTVEEDRDHDESPSHEAISEVVSFGVDVATDETTTEEGPKSRRQADGDEERGRSRRGSRRFPTWAEAVGGIVSSNMESRQKSGPPSGSRGRRRKSSGRKR
jgi:hypothetical protein